jgi:hypothetical protein
VIGSTRVNTFRVSAVKEDVFFGNPAFNETKDQLSLAPLLDYLTFEDGPSTRANRRLDVAYGFDNTFAWFVPNKRGEHDLKFGINYLYSTLRTENYGTQNGEFDFSHDLPFDASNPRTYPERFSIRVPGPVNFLVKGHFIGLFAQNKWKINDKLTLNFGGRYDVEIIPTPNAENPLFAGRDEEYPIDKNNFSPRTGFSYAVDDKSVLRGGFGTFYQRTSYTFINQLYTNTRLSNSFLASFPVQSFDPGTRQGRFPSDPLLLNGPVVNRALIDTLFPPGSVQPNTSTVTYESPDREVPWARQYSLGYERQLASLSASVDLIRSEQRAQYMMFDLNPPQRATGVATGQLTRTNTDPRIGAVGDYINRVETFMNVGWIDYTSAQVSVEKRLSGGNRLRVSYAFSRGRGNTDSGQETTRLAGTR